MSDGGLGEVARPSTGDEFCGVETAAAANEQLDFGALTTPHRADLFGFAMRLLRNRDAAGDLVQDTYVRALTFWSSFSFVGPGDVNRAVRGWLHCIMKTVFVNDYRRAQHARRAIAERWHDVVAANYGDTSNNPRERDLGIGDEVAFALANLHPDHRQILERAMHGHSYKKMARDLEVPIGTVMSRLYRARQQVKPALVDYAVDQYGLDESVAI